MEVLSSMKTCFVSRKFHKNERLSDHIHSIYQFHNPITARSQYFAQLKPREQKAPNIYERKNFSFQQMTLPFFIATLALFLFCEAFSFRPIHSSPRSCSITKQTEKSCWRYCSFLEIKAWKQPLSTFGILEAFF